MYVVAPLSAVVAAVVGMVVVARPADLLDAVSALAAVLTVAVAVALVPDLQAYRLSVGGTVMSAASRNWRWASSMLQLRQRGCFDC